MADYDGCSAPCCRSVCALADIIDRSEDLLRVKEYLTEETNIDTVLAEKMLHFELSASRSVRIPTGEVQGFTQLRPPGAWYHIRPRKG